MTANQVYIGVSLTVGLAVGCQLIGARLRIPALILLLPVGFTAGALTDDINPNNLLGASFQPIVSLSVALILYDSGLGLNLSKLTGHTRRVVVRLLLVGVPLTWIAATLLSAPLFGMAHSAALMLGAILVVSGPTVVGPLLGFVRPTERLRRTLAWEGSLIDPVGALLGAVVFHAVTASQKERHGAQIAQFVVSVGLGMLGAVIGVGVLWLLLCKLRFGEVLSTAAQVAVVLIIAALCDMLRDDSGLIAAIGMGLALSNIRQFNMPARRPFFEVLIQLIIGVLFISISATVTPQSVRHLVLPTLALVGALVLVIRPAVAALSALRTDLTRGERAFVGWMAPRGIVAAATASTFGASLASRNIHGAEKILPVTFLVIVMTVTIYGLTAEPVAKWLDVVRKRVTRPLVVGGAGWVIDLAEALQDTGIEVVMWADPSSEREAIQARGLELAPGGLIADATGQGAEVEGVTEILLLTDEHGFNVIASMILQGGEGGRVYRVGSPEDFRGGALSSSGDRILFDASLTGEAIAREHAGGARFSVVAGDAAADRHALLFRIRSDGFLAATTAAAIPPAAAGDTMVLFGPLAYTALRAGQAGQNVGL